jgi:alpha-aminoadipic semialdehyde synthase
MLVNGIYWDSRYPRLVTKEDLRQLRNNNSNNSSYGVSNDHLHRNNRKLRVIADISCDLEGSIEMLVRPSSIEQPYYTYLPESDTVSVEEMKMVVL